jgi:hypothetical protein
MTQRFGMQRMLGGLRLIVKTSLLLVLVTLSASCVRKIPGTEIDDTSDTRAVLDTVERYRNAFERRDVATVVEMADERFHDDAGTGAVDDDLEYRTLSTVLPMRLQKLEDMRLQVDVRRIEFENENQQARVTYTYSMSFKMPQLSGRPQNESDIKQMVLVRAGPTWKILSGI